MRDFDKLKQILTRIQGIAEEDSASVVSLGIIPAVKQAFQEVDSLAAKNCPDCGYPGLSEKVLGLKNSSKRKFL